MNNLHKFIFEHSTQEISFLGLKIHIRAGCKLSTTLYRKPTDCAALLHFCSSVEAQGSWVCTSNYTWFDFRTWKTVIGRSRKIWFSCPKFGQFVQIRSKIRWISKIFKICHVTTHCKGNFILIKNLIRNLCSKLKVKN